jgi:diaminopimelate epimerase
MSSLPFVKVQGLGNDFLVVDLRPGQPAALVRPSPLEPAVARALCDRHFGVGADGILAILPGREGDARMRVINADGSEAEMCGNGIRCVAKVLWEKDPALRRPLLRIDTGAGLLACAIDADEAAGRVRSVTVEMGQPRLTRAEIPMLGPPAERAVRIPLRACGQELSATAVSMGNPHVVIFVEDDTADLRALAEEVGPELEVDPTFPRRTNVELARVGAEAIELVVWERGCGITLACGTGACATVVAACLEGRAQPDQEVLVHLLGGTLGITASSTAAGHFSGVRMRGPADMVFAAEVDPARLVAATS